MADHHDDDGTRRHRRQFRRTAGYDVSYGHDTAASVPGRATSTDRLPAPPPKAAARRALLAVDGAIVRVEAMLPQLAAALDARRYLESGRLSIEVRTAIQRAATGLRPYAEDPEHCDAAAAAAERLHACTANAAPLLERAPILEAPDAGSEAAQKTWEADERRPAAETSASWDADAQELTRAAGLTGVDVKSDDEARSLTAAHGARGVALGSTVYLHPERSKPGSSEGRELLAHELVHLAQARLGAGDSLGDHAAAEQEAADLAPRLARGGAVTPRHRIDLSQPAADNGGPVATSLAQAEQLVASASRKFAVIQHKINANEMNDRPSASLAPELRAIGTLLATARTLIESGGTVPNPQWKQAQALRARIQALATDVETAEGAVTSTAVADGTSLVADIMGDAQPVPSPDSLAFTRGPRSHGAMTGMQADTYIRNTPAVYAAIRAGTKGSKLGAGRAVLHDSLESYTKALRKMLASDGKPHEDLDGEARSLASSTVGIHDQPHDLVHVHAPEASPDTTIHELIHVYTHMTAGAGGNLPHPMCEGAADYFTQLVCIANGLTFNVGYPSELRAFKALVSEVGFGDAASMVFSGTPMVMQQIEILGRGSWRLYTNLWREERYDDAIAMVHGLSDRIAAKALLDGKQAEATDATERQPSAESTARQDAAASDAAWAPEGTTASGKVYGATNEGGRAALRVRAGGKHGVRDGWRASVLLSTGERIEGTVTRTSTLECYVVVSRSLLSSEIDGNVVATLMAP